MPGMAMLGGTIQDESGATIVGARVTLTEESKGLVRQSEAGQDGSFLFSGVLAGVYSLRAEKEGFSVGLMSGLRIQVGEQAAVVITLHLGEIRTTVTVVLPTTTELDAESNTLGSVVDSARVRELPLNGRNFLELSQLTAGAVELSSSSNLFATNVGPRDRTIVLPGTLPFTVGYSLNGLNIKGSRDGELAVSPSVAGIDEFKVQENFVMPDQGMAPATVNIVTKSGSNQFHGEAFEFFRNRELDARSFFAGQTEDLKRNQFGFALGGPLRKDRIWFHGFYEGLRELTAFTVSGFSPTNTMFEGNFSETGRTIYDPASYNSSSGTRQSFQNDSIPLTRINPVAVNLLNYYRPGSSLAAIPSNIQGTPRTTLRDNQGGLRLDAALTTRHQLSTQVFWQDAPSDQPGLYPFSGLLYLSGSQLATLQDVWTVSPRAVNTLRAGFIRATAIGGNEARNMGPLLADIGIANTFSQEGITAINLQGYSSFGRSNSERREPR